MTPTASKYRKWSFNSMLVVLYLLFFAAQVNRQFYCAANFFVYSRVVPAKPEPHRLQTRFRDAESDNYHLRLDKRYQGEDYFRVEPSWDSFVIIITYTGRPQPSPEYEEGILTRTISCTCLRGPPAVA